MYQTYQNTLCIPAHILYQEEFLNVLSYSQYRYQTKTGKITIIRQGGNNHQSLIEFSTLPPLYKKAVVAAYGNPHNNNEVENFVNQLENNTEAYLFYKSYTCEEGKHLLPERIEQYYAECQVLELYSKLIDKIKLKRHHGIRIKVGPSKQEICDVIQEAGKIKIENSNRIKYPIGKGFPKNYRALDNKLSAYKKTGYSSLVHKAVGNNNSKKIKGDAAEWILSFYGQPNKPVVPIVHREYMRVRIQKNWPSLSESAISKWLEDPKQRKIWMLKRDGLSEWRNEFGHKLKRNREWFPNAYWAIDGTKLDWLHYKDNAHGMGADIKIDVVFDVYSECILGYSFSNTETHQDHFKAIKMAVNHTLKQPYLFTYDGQSGHTTSVMQDLYSKLVATNGGEHYKHAARQHGSPVEQLFSRFQQQMLNTAWFSDKQGMRTKTLKSQPNMDFLLENRHHLKKYDELERIFEQYVAQWNNAQHPKYKDETRQSVHNNHTELFSSPITIYHAMDMFWVKTKDARSYESSGIHPIISKTQYNFEVYDADGNVDLNFRDKYTGSKFFVQYDPDQMDNYVRLHLKLPNGNTKYIADAQPKRLTETIPVLMNEKKKAQMWKDRKVRERELERIQKKLDAIERRTGITPDQLIEDQNLQFKLGGKLPKAERNTSESNSFLDRI